MNFLFPAFLAGALAVAIPIALHFMRRDVAPEVPFSAVRLLQKSPIERSRRRRLRDLLLLAARVAALLLLAAAFARPYAPGGAAPLSGVRIIAVDRSFSMGAPGRFAQAVALARQAIDDAPVGERIALIAFDDRAEVLAEPGTAADARSALSGLAPGSGGTRYGALFTKIAETAGGDPGRVILVTDLQRAGWDDEQRGALPAALELELRDVGVPPANLAIGGVRVEAARIVALVRNTGTQPREGRLRVTREGAEPVSFAYTVGADTTVEVGVPYRAPATGSLTVVIEDDSGAAADNRRVVLLDPPAAGRVLVITAAAAPQSGFYLSRALAAAGDGESSSGSLDVRVASGRDVSAFAPEDYARYGAVAVLSTRGLDRRAREGLGALVRRGGGALIAAGPEVEPDVLDTIFGGPPALGSVDQPPRATALAATDLRHPIFRPFGALAANLGQVRFERTWRLKPEGWNVAARFTDGSPALLERPEGSGRVLVFASDLDRRWNDFPLHPAFVPFTVEAIRHATGSTPAPRELTVGSVPPGVPAEPGIHPAPPAGERVAVNVDPRESATTAMSRQEFEAMLDRVSPVPAVPAAVRAQQAESRQNYWQYGLLLMLAALVVESFIGRAQDRP